MRKLILFLSLILLVTTATRAQTTTLQQKLYYTCKVWGFVKYYHSEVSTCHTNWDSVLLHVLPLVQSSASDSEFNDALDTMLAAAGPMAIATSYLPDTLNPKFKRNRDWTWTAAPIFRSDVHIQLDTIKNNFRPHTSCWYEHNPGEFTGSLADSWGGYLKFPYDTVLLPVTTYTTFPGQNDRLLQLFKFWNIVQYFNPYNYALDVPWDTTLSHYVLPISTVTNADSLSLLYLQMAKAMDDAHVYGMTWSYYYLQPPGFYTPRLILKYMGGQYVVLKSMETGIQPGDAIISVDGLTTTQWEDSLKKYYSAGNPSVLRRIISSNLLRRATFSASEAIVVQDSTGATHTVYAYAVNPTSFSSFFSGFHYPNDSLESIKWTTMQCDVGYVNMGNIMSGDIPAMYADLQNKSAIIFDIRNYPNSTIGYIAYEMFAHPTPFSILTFPDTTYPGTYYYTLNNIGYYSTNPYFGKVIVLVDETTQSQAEYSTMVLKAMPNTVVVGSQTAGADGDITWIRTCDDMRFGWTSLGVYYPNWDSTQRIGIVPDTLISPTKHGIRRQQDEVLEKALQIAGCQLQTVNASAGPAAIYIHPNPAQDEVSVNAFGITGSLDITISDLSGKILMRKAIQPNGYNSITPFDISNLASGMYMVNVKTDVKQFVFKLIKN